MNITALIRNFFIRNTEHAYSEHNVEKTDVQFNQQQKEDSKKSAKSEFGLEFLDGMSTGTARFIIDREVDPDVLKNYHVKDLENKGRYYLAKIVNQDGEVTDTVLIDKLNRSIHFQKAKP